MTTVPEVFHGFITRLPNINLLILKVVLAKEVGLCYAAIALPTDYDCWHDSTECHVRL